jgi:integrase
MAPKTVRNIAGVVSAAYKEGLAWGVVERNPVTDSKRPKGAGKQGKSYTSFDQNLIIKGTVHWALPVILELAAATGARRGEVLALRWRDFNPAVSEIIIGRSLSQTKVGLHFKEPKTPAGYRTLTLPESTVKLLVDHRKAQSEARLLFGPDYRSDLDLIICNPDGEPLKPDSISGTVSNYLKRLKVGGSLHQLRHSHGSHLLAAGVELTAVSERLGHADASITARVYGHAVKGRDAEAAKKWEEFQGRGTEQAKEKTQ